MNCWHFSQTLIPCLFSWCVTITRQGAGRFEVFLFLSFKPNYYKRLEPVLYRDKNSNILMALKLAESTFTAFWSSSELGRYSRKLHRFLFAPETKNDTSSTKRYGPSKTLAPVRTTLPETNMRRTIRGFTILMRLDICRIFNVYEPRMFTKRHL